MARRSIRIKLGSIRLFPTTATPTRLSDDVVMGRLGEMRRGGPVCAHVERNASLFGSLLKGSKDGPAPPSPQGRCGLKRAPSAWCSSQACVRAPSHTPTRVCQDHPNNTRQQGSYHAGLCGGYTSAPRSLNLFLDISNRVRLSLVSSPIAIAATPWSPIEASERSREVTPT